MSESSLVGPSQPRPGTRPADSPAERVRRRWREGGGGLGLAAGEADQQAERDQRRDQRRAAVGDQRQRDADDGQQREHHADVDHHLAEQPDHDAEGHVADERVGGVGGDPDRGVGDGEEQADHQQGADQAELLAEHREDEVGVGLGQLAPLLLAGADALAEPAAARQRVEAVGGLPAGVVVVLERVDEGGDALEPLGVGGGQEDREHADDRDAEGEEPGRRADHPEHAEQDREQHQRGAEVPAERPRARWRSAGPAPPGS